MSENKLHTITRSERERALLIGLSVWPEERETTLEHLEELELLADTAGADTVLKVVQGLPRKDSAFFIGKGKVEELAEAVKDEDITLVIVDDDLSPVQARNLGRMLERKVIDRSGLILDIFAQRARSSEARTQVELAQLQYMLPRLTRQWTHLSKQFGGIGTKGPGETQIETDRRMIRSRIAHLREKLERIEVQRETQRKGRGDHFRVALVGYTNAGKSTLMNELSGAAVHAEDRLFATLDSTVRAVELTPGRTILLSDTVGFIRKLPSHLVASFRSTLAEAREADLLLHVVDVASSTVREQIQVVEETLKEIEANQIPVVMVFNKVDLLQPGDETLAELRERYPESVAISAMRGLHIHALRSKLVEMVEQTFCERLVRIPLARYSYFTKVYDYADVIGKEFDEEHAIIKIRFSPKVRDHVEHILALAMAQEMSPLAAQASSPL
ncbi:MAG TPA: GTPase HflX [Candidatus Kapabacteria bacterium]|nr:GTPase HflX [Candidatus Kapabacteria bacterium]